MLRSSLLHSAGVYAQTPAWSNATVFRRRSRPKRGGCTCLFPGCAEISRAQIWQWIRHGAKFDDGRTIDAALCCAVLDEELAKLRETATEGGRYEDAAKLFRELIEAPTFPEFLTLPAYDMITAEAG